MGNLSKDFIGKAFVGIDVHKNSWKVCVLGDVGFKKEFSCDPETKVLVKSLENLLPKFSFDCAYEAGFSGFWLHDELYEYEGFNCIVVNAADIPTSDKERAQKEDRRDARKIASQLKAEALRGIYVPSKEDVSLREVQRLRYTMTKDLVRYQARIKSFLMRHGIEVPKAQFKDSKAHWSKKFMKWLSALKLETAGLSFTLNQLIETTTRFRAQKAAVLLELRKQIQASSKKDAFEKLMSIPGIGVIGASTILTEIVDINRFRTYEKFHSFIGLVPSTNSSDVVEKIRGITHRSNRRLRNVLIEASWIAIRYNTDLFVKYNELKQRMNSNKAIIRVAKKLSSQVRYVLLELESQATTA
jgi:transposase